MEMVGKGWKGLERVGKGWKGLERVGNGWKCQCGNAVSMFGERRHRRSPEEGSLRIETLQADLGADAGFCHSEDAHEFRLKVMQCPA
jgi:hypothetical protein